MVGAVATSGFNTVRICAAHQDLGTRLLVTCICSTTSINLRCWRAHREDCNLEESKYRQFRSMRGGDLGWEV